jgi:hypothetical protein
MASVGGVLGPRKTIEETLASNRGRPRPFRTPLVPLVPILAIAGCA